MEESIRRAEKLVHATNSALAQMKYNLTFDNPKRESQVSQVQRHHPDRKKKKNSFYLGQEFEQFEQEFRSETSEMLSKMDKLLDSNHLAVGSNRFTTTQASKAREKMKEINRKLEARRMEQQKLSDMGESRQKLLTLISENEFSQSARASSKHTVSSKSSRPSRDKFSVRDAPMRTKPLSTDKQESLPPWMEEKPSRERPKDELKSKLLETQEIVDRGFQTARQLTHRFENITKAERKPEKTPMSTKSFVSDMTYTKGLDASRKSESNETIRTVGSRRCSKCQQSAERRKKREKREKEAERSGREELERKELQVAGEERNHRVVNVRRLEPKRQPAAPKLNLQHLPSVTIRSGLQMQKVHSLEIPPETGERVTAKPNTSTTILSHEEIERERSKKALDEIRRENCLCRGMEDCKNRIECFNCGNLIKVRETPANPREIDKLLLKCGFNVFDPRIDEFVENCKFKATSTTNEFETQGTKAKEASAEDATEEKSKTNSKPAEKLTEKPIGTDVERMRRTFKIQELSQKLTKKYREKANELEENRQELGYILKSLFKKIDDSRELFDNCLFESLCEKNRDWEGKKPNLQTTKPVVVCLTENSDADAHAQSAKKVEKAVETDRTDDERRGSCRRKERKKKLDKKDVKNKCKSRTSESLSFSDFRLSKYFSTDVEGGKKAPTEEEDELLLVSPKYPSIGSAVLKALYGQEENQKPMQKFHDSNAPADAPEVTTSATASTESIREVDVREPEESDMEIKTEDDYESDFEGESPTLRNNNVTSVAEEEDTERAKVANKLSTISEVDSELEKKLSDDGSGKSTSTVKTLDVSKCDSVGGLAKNKEMKHEIVDLVNRAFEKGVAYTLKKQTNALEAIQVVEPEAASVDSPSSSRTSLDSIRKSQILDETKSPSPKSQAGRPKSAKSKSELSVTQRSSSTEVVASLKDVLSALKDQFERTQTLADKLTENVRVLKVEKESDRQNGEIVERQQASHEVLPMLWQVSGDSGLGSDVVSNLQKVRKDLGGFQSPKSNRQKSPFTLFQDSPNNWTRGDVGNRKFFVDETKSLDFSDDGGPSIGEVVMGKSGSASRTNSERSLIKMVNDTSRPVSKLRENSEKKEAVSPAPTNGRIDEASYSEGEIPILLEADGSSMQSIGELISESVSVVSGLE